MKMMLKYCLTNVRERRARTAVMLLSIVLSATLLFVSFSIGVSYESAQRKMARGLAGSATVAVTAVDGAISREEIPELPSVGAAAGIWEGSALYHENGYYESIDLIGADLAQLNRINPPRLADGGEITGFSGNQVILPDRFTSKYGIEEGNNITLEINGNPVEFQVARIAAYDTVFLRHTRGATALLPLSTAARLLGQPEGYGKILIEPAEGVSTEELKRDLQSVFPPGDYRVSETVNQAQIAADARQKTMPFFLISFFAMTMSVFIIYSSYKVITLDRLPVIGTFRSIGATRRTVTCMLLLESVFYGSLGGAAGILLGLPALKLILRGMGASLGLGIEIPVVISSLGIGVSLAVAVLVPLLSAWIPVRRASRLPLREVMAGALEEAPPSRRLVVAVGAALFGISVALPRAASGKLLYLAGGCSLLGLIAGAILIIPPLSDLLSMGLERLYGALPGNEAALAARNMRENRNIQQNITLLFISISAVIAISVVGDFVTSYVSDVFRGAELEGFADGTMEPEFVERVRRMDGVETVLPLHVYKDRIQAGGRTFRRVEATDNLERYVSMFALHETEKGALGRAEAVFDRERTVLLSEDCMERTGFHVGDVVALFDGAVQREYRVGGSFKSRATDVEAVISSSFAAEDFGADAYQFLAYTAADPEAVMVQIRDLFGGTPNWSRTVEEFYSDALSTVGAFLRPMHSMIYFILLMAGVGVTNNLLINYMQKRRVTAMYKSVGLSNRQHAVMALAEAFSSGLIGAAVAVFVSWLEIGTIFLVAGPKIQMAPELNAAVFCRAGIMGIAVTLLGSAVPIVKCRRMKLVEEIKVD